MLVTFELKGLNRKIVVFWIGCLLAWENSQHLAMLLLVSPPNDVWETSAEIPYWWRDTTQIWVVLLIGKGTFLANQVLYPDLGSVTSSVWNFWACFSDVISWESQWWHLKILDCLLRLQTESIKRKKTARNLGLECRPSLKCTCRGDFHSFELWCSMKVLNYRR